MKKWGYILFVVVLLAGGAALFLHFRKPAGHTVLVQPPKIDSSRHFKKLFFGRLDSFFTHRSQHDGFSGSVLIAYKGEPVYEKCFGWCDYKHRGLMNDTASFQLASVSKTFTATAVLWLAEQGKLSLDDSIEKFFPDFPYKGIKIQYLLCHRSGLPNYLYFCNKLCGTVRYLTNKDVIDYMIANKPALYAHPNRKYEYNNTNYMLLGAIIERVTGQKLKDFMRETFFEPLGMNHTFIYDAFDSTDRKIAISYNNRWQIQGDDCFDGVVGDKGVYSTVRDLFTWDQAFYQGKLLSQQMMEEAYKPRSFERPGLRNYGYGWHLIKKPDDKYLVYHNGWWHGNNTVFYRNIEDTTTVIILSNRFNKYVYNVQPVWEILYGLKPDTTGINGEE